MLFTTEKRTSIGINYEEGTDTATLWEDKESSQILCNKGETLNGMDSLFKSRHNEIY
jgi:hypothetical protein